MNDAIGSPAAARCSSSWEPLGSGMPTATPMVRATAALVVRARRQADLTIPCWRQADLTIPGWRQEAHPVVHVAQGDRGDRPGLLRTHGEELVQLGRVVEVRPGAGLYRPDEVGHRHGQVLL